MKKIKSIKKIGACALAILGGLSLIACKDSNGAEESETYTYNGVYSGNISNWNPQNMSTTTDSLLGANLRDGLYHMDFNSDRTTYEMNPGMAKELPEDVTSEYQGKYQVPEGASANYAYRVRLREGMKFEDGKEITATDFIESYKRLIDTNTNNKSASAYESGNLIISGSAYYKNNGKQDMYVSISDVASYDKKTKEEVYEENKENDAYVDWTSIGTVIKENKEDGFTETKIGDNIYYTKEATKDDAGDSNTGFSVAEFKEILEDFMSSDYADYILVSYDYRNESFEDTVGIVKIDEYTFDIISDIVVTEFYFMYTFTSCFLIDTELYDNCKNYSGDSGMYDTYYATSIGTTNSYGPYKLVEYIDNKEFKLARNENWYGYKLPENEGLYQTTNMHYERIDESQTQLQSFLKGDLDEIQLNNETVKSYVMSDNLLSTPTVFTVDFYLNTDYDLLKKCDDGGTTNYSTFFANSDFRKAMSISLDRDSYAKTVSAGCKPEAVLINDLYISNTDNGTSYRSTDEAKQSYADAYDGATNASDTYQPEKAYELFAKAYNEYVEKGYYTPGEAIKFTIGTTNTSSEYTSVAKYMTEQLTKITQKTNEVKGTNFGTVTVEINGTDGSNRYRYLTAGKYSMIWGGRGGSVLNPYIFYNGYLHPDYNYCPGFDANEMGFSAKLSDMEEEEYHSYMEWFEMLNYGEYATKSENLRNELLGEIESHFLKEYTIIPLYALTYFNLVSDKIEYGTKTYVSGIGFGGFKYMTYKYSDSEWEEYVKTNSDTSGNLDYTE